MEKIILGVGAVVLYKDKILLVKRGKDPCRGCWAIPGGRVEYGESILDTASRELLEETGVKGIPIGVVWVDEILPGEECNEQFVLVDILVKPLTLDVKAGSDALDAGFFELDKPPTNTTPSTMRLINYIRYMLNRYGKIYFIPVSGNEQVI